MKPPCGQLNAAGEGMCDQLEIEDYVWDNSVPHGSG